MPFSGPADSSLPKNVKSMSPSKRSQWVHVFNSAFASCQKAGGSNCDGIAMRKANGVAKAASYVQLLAKESKGRSFVEFKAADVPPTINIFPVPGTYRHPVWGNMEVTEEGNQLFVDNFNAHVYQKHIPLDAEHETKVSGAVAYFEELYMNEDGSVEAIMEWTPRGEKLLEDDAFKFISPEWYEEWTDPATQKDFENVLIGGALTTRPFFKGLRSLVANEDGMRDIEKEGAKETTIERIEIDLREVLVSAASKEFSEILGENISVVNLADDHLVVENGAGQYFRLEYTATDNEVTFTKRPALAEWNAAEHPGSHDDEEEDKDKKKKRKNKNKNKNNKEATVKVEEVVEAAEQIKDEDEKKSWLSKIASAFGLTVEVKTDDGDNDEDDDDEDEDDKEKVPAKASEQITSLESRLATEHKAREASEKRLGVLESTARNVRLRDIVLGRDEESIKRAAEGDGVKLHPMVGDLAAKMKIMETLGEGSEEFVSYVAQERESASALHAAGTFSEIGENSTDGSIESSPVKQFEAIVASMRKEDSDLSEADAIARVAKEDPALYAKYDKEASGRKAVYQGN